MDLFVDDLKINVKIDNGEFGSLELGLGTAPKLTISSGEFCHNEYCKIEDINSSKKYTLFEILDFDYPYVFYKYLLSGRADFEKIKKIQFLIPELSSYFKNTIKINLDCNGNLSANVNIEPIETILSTSDMEMKINISQSYKVSDKKNGFDFTNEFYLCFEFEKYLSFKDIENYFYKSIRMLTWITGYSLKVTKVDIYDNDNNKSELYFPIAKVNFNSKHDLSKYKALIKPSMLKDNFHRICSNYFIENEILFDKIWSRTIPLFDFEGVLEYEIMLYTSILDKYCSYQVENLNLTKVVPEIKYDNLSEELCWLINSKKSLTNYFISNEFIDLRNKDVLKRLIKNSSPLTFFKKYKLFIGYIGKKVLKIFISNDEIHEIKGVRDRAAHGENEFLSGDDLFKLCYKLKMLIIYLIYKDMGINDKDFLNIISSCHHPIVNHCKIDRYKLDCMLERAVICNLNEKDFLEISDKKSNYVIQKNGNLYEYKKEYTQSLNKYFFTPGDKVIRSMNEYIDTLIDDSFKSNYFGNVYLKYKNNVKSIWGVIIIEKV